MKRTVLILALSLASLTALFAGEAGKVQKTAESETLSLTVEDAVQYALENSKSLKSSAIDLEIAKRAADNSWNVLLPSLSASATASRQSSISSTVDSANNAAHTAFKLRELDAQINGKTSTDPLVRMVGSQKAADYYSMMSQKNAMEDTETNHWAVIGNVGAQWNFNLAMIESIKAAKKQYEAGQITWEQANRDTEVNIRKMFYGILLQQDNLEIQKESLKNAESRWKQAEINYKNGMVPRLSMLNAKVTYENKKPSVLSAEQSLKQNKEMFGFLLGLPYGKPIELVGSIEFSYIDVDADDLFRDYIDRNNDIISLQKQKDLLEISIRAKQLSTFTPSLSVGYTYQPILYSAGSWASGEPTDNGSLSVTLVYSNLFNMLPFSSNMQEIKNARQQLTQVQLGLEQLYQNTEIEIHKLCDNLSVAKENIEAMERNVTIAQEAYESTLKAYNAGTQERLELQDSETQLNQAKLGLLNEKYNYISALLDLETKLNIKLR